MVGVLLVDGVGIYPGESIGGVRYLDWGVIGTKWVS